MGDLHCGRADSLKLREKFHSALPRLAQDLRAVDAKGAEEAPIDVLAESLLMMAGGGISRFQLASDPDALEGHLTRRANKWGLNQPATASFVAKASSLLLGDEEMSNAFLVTGDFPAVKRALCAGARATYLRELMTYLAANRCPIDILAVVGDFVERVEWTEAGFNQQVALYESRLREGFAVLEAVCQDLAFEDKQRVILVSGNHDLAAHSDIIDRIAYVSPSVKSCVQAANGFYEGILPVMTLIGMTMSDITA